MIGEAEFRAMKKSAVIMNVGRGPVIDEAAMIRALEEGRIKGAALDVFDREPLPDGHWLYSHPGVRLSPHISWSIPEARGLLHDPFRENLRRYLDGVELINVVNVQLGY